MSDLKSRCRSFEKGDFVGFGFAFAASLTGAALADDRPAPLNYFLHSHGPAASPTMHLGWFFVALLTVIFVIVVLLMLAALFRKRPSEAPEIAGHDDQGMAWLYVGAGLSTVMLFGLAIYSLTTLDAIARPASAPALTVTVTAHDWWWQVEYEHDVATLRFPTANEIHIPVGLPVLVRLKSADVIHAFWVPMLAGKTQAIPGLTNQQWLQADAEGVYRGQCMQYCGVQHAHMGFEVVAQSTADFDRWLNAQRKPAAPVRENANKGGEAVFLNHCGGCHAIRGTPAAGALGPDLTHLKSRHLIAGGLLTNTPEHLAQWIGHAQDLKPGSLMPAMTLKPAELSALTAYLSTLD